MNNFIYGFVAATILMSIMLEAHFVNQTFVISGQSFYLEGRMRRCLSQNEQGLYR